MGSRIRDPESFRPWIRDKRPGSATLDFTMLKDDVIEPEAVACTFRIDGQTHGLINYIDTKAKCHHNNNNNNNKSPDN
jgi:hypothetical protein